MCRCQDLVILETYTARGDDLELPDFLDIAKDEITSDPNYSMYNLSKKPDSAILKQRVRSCSEGERNDLNGPGAGKIHMRHKETSVDRCNGVSSATNGHRQSTAS